MARSFNGSTDQIIASGTPISAYPITLAAWGYAGSLASNGCAIGIANNGVAKGFAQLSTDNTGPFVNFGIQNLAGTTTSQSGTTVLSTNTWFHMAGSSTSGGAMAVYTNGGNKQTNAGGGITVDYSPNNVGIGALNRSTTVEFWNGRLVDTAIWNVVLSDAEIAALAKGARPYTIRPTALKGYWPLDGLASPEPDLSGFRLNGTLTGTALAAGPPTMMFTPPTPSFLDKVPITAVFRKSLSSTSRVGARQRVAW